MSATTPEHSRHFPATSNPFGHGPAPRAIAVAVVTIGILATGLIFWLTRIQSRQAVSDDFDRIATEATLRLEGRLHGYEEALHASAGFVMGSDEVNAAEWRRFEETLRIDRLLPGSTAMAYAIRRPSLSGIQVQVLDSESYGSPLPHGEALEDPAAIPAMEQACSTGELAGFLPGDPGPESEVVLLQAVYRAPRTHGGRTGCADSLMGLVLLRFRPGVLTQSLNLEGNPTAAFALSVRGPQGSRHVLGDTGGTAARQIRVIPFRFAGRGWALEARSLPSFDRLHARHAPQIILAAGLIITVLAGALAGSEAQRRRLVREAVSSMQRRLDTTTSALGQSTARSHEVEVRLAGLIDSAMDAIISLNPDGRIRLMNPAAERMLGCSSSQVIGHSVLRLFPRSMREIYLQEVAAFGGGATHRTIGVDREATACRFDGEEFPIEATIALARSEGSLSYTMIVRDVSERKATEFERRRLEAQLRQSQKMEAIGTLAGGIAHDFNNILGSILGNAELADQDLPEGHSAREFLSEITRAGERARDLVRRILGFTRQQDQLRKAIRLEQVADEVTQMLRASLPARIDVGLDQGSELPSVLADAGQMHQVLMNLITNSAHALADRQGSIRVTLRRISAGSDTSLPVALVARDCLQLGVSDDGVGMGAGVLERMFDPFFTTKPVGQGTGLGLSVVHGIVQQHEGIIRVSSTPGVGTSVRIYLPGLGEEPELSDAPAQSVPSGRGERVLLVDDEEALLLMNDRILRRLGYTPVIARGPAHALAMLEDGQEIDMVLTDLSMPGMSGIELAARVLRIRPELPIILLTGYDLSSSPEELRVQGIRAVLPKPVTIHALAETLAAANPVHA